MRGNTGGALEFRCPVCQTLESQVLQEAQPAAQPQPGEVVHRPRDIPREIPEISRVTPIPQDETQPEPASETGEHDWKRKAR